MLPSTINMKLDLNVKNGIRNPTFTIKFTTAVLPGKLIKKLHIFELILPSTIKMRLDLNFNYPVVEGVEPGSRSSKCF